MPPKKKRRRKVKTITDSGLGVSLQENGPKLLQNETCVPELGNVHRESEIDGNLEQLSEAGNGCLTKGKASKKNGQSSLEENDYPEITGGIAEVAAVSPRRERGSSEETVRFPSKPVQLLETETSAVCISEIVCDSDSENAIRELLQSVIVRSQASNEENESEQPVCTACAEGSDNDNASGCSSETEIFLGNSKEPRSTLTSPRPHNDESFSLSKICASQKTGKIVAEGREVEERIRPENNDISSVEHSVAVVSHSCPADIGMQRQILISNRHMLPNPFLSSVRKKLPFKNKVAFQLYRPHFTGFSFGRGSSVIHESPKFVEQENRGEQIEKGDVLPQPSTQSLSVWSDAQSEYFPRGKPSDLGELLEIATRYVVKAWVKEIHPPISGPPTNLVIKFCVDCHKKYHYKEDESSHLCSKHVGGSQKSLKLMFYVELEIYDETHEMLRVALTGNQATKLFGCQPQEFVRNEEFQKRVLNSFKRLLKGGNTQNWCLKDAADFSLEPHLNGHKMNYRVVDIRPFSNSTS